MKTTRMILLVLSALILLAVSVGCSNTDDIGNADSQLASDTQPSSTQMEESQFESIPGVLPVNPEYEENPIKIACPWDEEGAKQPSQYSWAEFEALTPAQQIIFQTTFEDNAFDAWLQKEQSDIVPGPWEAEGAKQPAQYTWAEFEALSAQHQIIFQHTFESTEAFDAWMQQAQDNNDSYPWEIAGAKQPSEYTWSEFESLSAQHQMAFQFAFDSSEAFDQWLTANEPK